MTIMSTTAVLCLSWSRSGQVTRLSSPRTSLANLLGPVRKPPPLFCDCFLLDPADPRFLPIVSSHGFASRSRAGGTRTPDLRFWRPLLYQLSYCPPLKTLTGSPGGWCASYPTGNTSLTGCGPGCCAGSCACGSSGACTPRKPALLIVAQSPSESQERGIAPPPSLRLFSLLQYLGDDPGTHRPAALADGEVQALVHGDRRDELNLHNRVVPGHYHLHPLLQPYLPRNVGCAEVELRAVLGEERRVASSL